MFYKGSGGLKSMFFEAISAAQKSEEKHVYIHPTLVTRWLFKFEPKERKRKSEREKKIF